MKPTTLRNGKLFLAIAAIILTVGLISWDHKQAPGQYQQSWNDSIPKKKSTDKDKKVRDLDDVLDELNDVDIKFDHEKMRQQIEEAMKNIDGDKIKLQIEKAMKDVDFDKIQKQIKEAMKEIDFAKIQHEIQESIAKVDWDKIKEEINKVKDIDMKELQKEMDKLREELKDLKPKIEKELGEARVEIEKAKAELTEYKEFIDDLDKDGLISKKDGYKLKHGDGVLLINGKKATGEVYNKYKSFLEKHKKFRIEKTNDDFDIDTD